MSKTKNLVTRRRDKARVIKAVGAAIDNLDRTSSEPKNQLVALCQEDEAHAAAPAENDGEKKRRRNSTRLIRFVIVADMVPLVVRGRAAWCLKELLLAGSFGITGCRGRGRRLAAHIYILRRRYNLEITTQFEPHGGSYPGHHARYRLSSEIKVLCKAGDGQ